MSRAGAVPVWATRRAGRRPTSRFCGGGGRYFDRLRGDPLAQSFLDGAGSAAIGAIFGSACC